MQPLVSIIVTCYNYSEYLDGCIKSVVNQSFKNWECIIVNDGSTDNSLEIAQKWSSEDKRIKVLDLENCGVSKARNKGIEIASAEWILPLDADDFLMPNLLHLFQKEKKEDTVMAVFSTQFFGNENKIYNAVPLDYKKLLIENLYTCSSFYKKSDWQKIGGYDEHPENGFEDWEFYINLLKGVEKDKIIKLSCKSGIFVRTKEVSRSQNIYSSEEKVKISQNFIVKKHLITYQKYFPSYIKLIQEKRFVEKAEFRDKQYMMLTGKIRKNFLTKALYKIIEFLN